MSIKSGLALIAFSFLLATAASLQAAGYEQNPKALSLMHELVNDYDFDRRALEQWLAAAEKKQSILDAISRPAEKVLTWGEYRNIFLTTKRIDKGVKFWEENQQVLQQIEHQYGVPAEIIVAIIGVETRYGEHKGNYRVIDALSTLAFDYPPRQKFFTKELKHFLLLAKEQGQNPLELKGSYAGAMGYGQFMPSSFREYAVDYDGDRFADIWNNKKDAIASVANYFVRHGWRPDEAVTYRATVEPDYNKDVIRTSLKPFYTVEQLAQQGFTTDQSVPPNSSATAMKLDAEDGDEFWLGLHNFYVITRYNHSHMYAMAVYQLSQEILKRALTSDGLAGVK